MALMEVNRDPSPREVRQFACYLLPGFCCLLAGWAVYRYESWPAAYALVAGAVVSLVLGLIKPLWMKKFLVAWMLAAFPIGWVVSHVAMAIIYFLVVTPIALLMRIVGRDPLSRRFDPQAKTYWTTRPTAPRDPASYFRQF